MQSQQNSQPHTAQVIWLQLPSFILMMYALQRGHGLMSSATGRKHGIELDSAASMKNQRGGSRYGLKLLFSARAEGLRSPQTKQGRLCL